MNLFIAVTTYEDKVFAKCASSLLNNCANLAQSGHKIVTHFESELYIDLARNKCIDEFLKTNCSDILFVDADLSFENNAIHKIIEHEKNIVAGAYRLKHPYEHYPVIIDWDNHNNCKEEATGLVWVKSAPTGFMRINRKVFEDMIEHYKMEKCSRGIYHFFETGMKVFNDGKWWGEDTSFCWKWRNMGGEVFVEPRIEFTHTGNQEFKGNYHKHLESGGANKLDQSDDGINGWMTPADTRIIKELASKCKDVVEVGSWKGRSTKEFIGSCSGTVYAVDHFSGGEKDVTRVIAQAQGDNIYEQFMENVGHYKNLKVLRGDSVEMAKSFNGNMVDMVFIDAGHSYEECKADIEAWLPKCKKIIAGHDYTVNCPGVIRAVGEFAEGRDVKVKGTVWFCEL